MNRPLSGAGRSWLPGAFAAGAVAFPLTLIFGSSIQSLAAAVFRWGPDAVAMTLGAGLIGAVITAAVNEVFKLAAAFGLWALSKDRNGVVTFGAAAGAGFATVGAYQVIHFALMARALPFSTSSSFGLSLVQQLAFVAVNASSTALAALGIAQRRPVAYLAAAVLCETVFAAFGLLYELQAYSTLVWTFLAAVSAGALVAAVLILDRRGGADAALASTA